ncbi:unnamed protein product [Adineta ricciae]|uniref:Coiled-coil domain-containing protein 181 n=1 Tax=Adineta ricciae TaxID=249248 RepID=A0A815E1G0_ADIRI|nr:unnamed protein product [Adineta ricciae]
MAKSSFPSYDRSVPIISDDSILSSPNHRFPLIDADSGLPLSRQHSDDADVLQMKRQHPNMGFRDHNTMSNSVDDLTQLTDHISYPNSSFGQDFSDPDDDELHFDNGSSIDYDISIQERLKRANEVFEHDKTPAELTHQQRVSFDSVVKAVQLVQDPEDGKITDSSDTQPISPVVEESTIHGADSQDENSPHEYTVPLNDTKPRDTPTLVEQIKAMQFYGGSTVGGDRRVTSTTNASSSREDNSSSKLTANSDANPSTTSSATQSSVIVARNGKFEFQTEDDYTAKRAIDESDSGSDNDDNQTSTTKTTKVTHSTTSSNPIHHSSSSSARPKSSDDAKRTDNKSSDPMSKSLAYNKTKSTTNNQQRAKSAVVSKSIESFILQPCSVDFEEMNRTAAERKRAELQEECRKKNESDIKRREDLLRAQESFAKWLHDKEAERRRLNEERRLEREEEMARQEKCEKELGELREKKYKEWIERKNREAMKANELKQLQTEEEYEIKSNQEKSDKELREKKYREWFQRKDQQVMMAEEFKKLQAKEDEMTSGGSSSSIHNSSQQNGHRAFRLWLRRKNEESREEKRRLRLETRRLRRHQRRSLKRYQLQQDLQLARSFGYT